ncbi:MAG: metal-dependent transcriptional regulator [Candidatus Caldarchaeum sp.]|uniref:Metal-dependent transcriptional regulator n=1 Tax=Caldiarchaeum subterraneum TaxID=311458 RepID=A0A7C5Q8S8_CALS0
MPKMTLNPVEASYLREMYRKGENSLEISTGDLAKIFDVRPASVVDVVHRLARKKLVEKQGWGKIALSKKGLSVAARIIHNHRVLETYFSRGLGLEVEDSCTEAAKIDYLIGDKVIRRLCEKLSFPEQCIHGFEVSHEICRRRL